MRVMYIHAGKRINKKDLKADEFHVGLFRDKLRLRFENNRNSSFIDTSSNTNNSTLDTIESLPRGEILGIALFNNTYWYNQKLHSNDPWKLGPFCYEILDVFRFERGVPANGQLGIWTPKQDAQNQIAAQISVQNKINQWKQQYGDKLYFGKDPNGVPSAITILQPFVEGILRGLKRIENRKRPFFRLHDNKLLYKHPITPIKTQCKFCPENRNEKCKYWAHVNEEKTKRIRRNHSNKKASKSLSQLSQQSTTPETDNEYYDSTTIHNKIEYNTRQRDKKIQSFINGSLYDIQKSIPTTNTNTNTSTRKRKRSQSVNNLNDTPPQKKHKHRKKKHKKHKKRHKEKKKKMHVEVEVEEVSVEDKWENFRTDYLFGEDGCVPLRMCWHGTIMKGIALKDSKNKLCSLCNDKITWDHYYKCKCNNTVTYYCFPHTRPLTLTVTKSWENINNKIKNLNNNQRFELIQSLKVDTPSYINNNNNKKHIVGDDATATATATVVNVDNGPLSHIQFDPTKMKMGPLINNNSNSNGFNMSPLKQIPIKFNLDVSAIANSVNFVQNNNVKNGVLMNGNGSRNNNNKNNKNKMDFSSFPSVTPNMNGGHPSSMVFNNGNIQFNSISQTNHTKTTVTNPPVNTAMLSLSQILNQNINTNNSNNNNNKVTPVPSPFAPSPSPTHNNSNNKNVSSINNVYTLQNLLNKNSVSNATTNGNPNPFGPTANNTKQKHKQKPKQKQKSRSNRHKNDSVENSTSATSTSTNSNNNKQPQPQPITINPKPLQSYHYGPVIAPSYQTMPQPIAPTHPMQLQGYSTLPIQNINGQMVYMVPGQHNMANMAYYQPLYQYQQYSNQTQNKNNNIPVPVQQT